MELLWLLLMWSPLCLHSPAYPIRRLKRASEINEVLQESVVPTAHAQLSPDKTDSLKNEEQNTLRKLVSLLQDMVIHFPTRRPHLQLPTQKAHVSMSSIALSSSVMVTKHWKSQTLKSAGTPTETAALANERATSETPLETMFTTPLENNRNSGSAAIIILSDREASEKTTPEYLQSKPNVTEAEYSHRAFPEQQPATTESLLVDDNKTATSPEDKTSGRLTNGALSNLVDSLKGNETLADHPSNNGPQENIGEGQGQQNKSVREDVLELINVEIKSIANAPPSIKNDPTLSYYLNKSESFLKDALQRAGEAEENLKEEKEEGHAEEAEREGSPSPSGQLATPEEALPLTPGSSSSLAKNTEDAQLESGKLTALIKLLYSFSPHLMGRAENPPNK